MLLNWIQGSGLVEITTANKLLYYSIDSVGNNRNLKSRVHRTATLMHVFYSNSYYSDAQEKKSIDHKK